MTQQVGQSSETARCSLIILFQFSLFTAFTGLVKIFDNSKPKTQIG